MSSAQARPSPKNPALPEKTKPESPLKVHGAYINNM